MEELINQITSRTGISDEQAQQAVDTVISFAKSKLPEPFASQFEALLNSGDSGDVMSQLQAGLGSLGGLFGK